MRKRLLSNRGMVVVETLVVLPLLLLVVTAVAELSILSFKKIALSNAVEMATHMYAATGDSVRAEAEVRQNYAEGTAFTFSCSRDTSAHLASCEGADDPKYSISILKQAIHFRAKSYAPTAD